MQFLSFPPRAVTAIFTQMLYHQSNIFEVLHAGIRVPKPQAFGMAFYQGSRTLHQFRRGWCWWRTLSQFIRCFCRGLKLTCQFRGIKHGPRWLTIRLRRDVASLNSALVRAMLPQVELARFSFSSPL